MVRNGYDVWLGNNRGTTYSRQHTVLNPDKDKKYWEYSFPELGDFDAPAQIDFVREMTGVEKLTYIGHSQGTTQMFYALSTDHDFWVDRINLFVALAPVVNLGNTDSSFIQFIARIDGFLSFFAKMGSGTGELFRKGTKIRDNGGWCKFIPFCKKIAGFLDAIGNPYDNDKISEISFGHYPNGASLQQILHFGQTVKSGKFRLYDHGVRGNMEHYRQ